jgi:repressor LexA
MRTLTAKQKDLLATIKSFKEAKGYSPTVRELQSHYGYKSPTVIQKRLESLEKRGLIEREPKIARSIRIKGE